MTDEFDRLVAEKVMGWKVKNISTSNYGSRADVWIDEAITETVTVCKDNTFSLLEQPKIQAYVKEWKPTKNLDQTWQVEEKIDDLNLSMKYAKELYQITHADLGDFIEETWWIMIHSTPLRRCLAALKAVGVEANA